MHLYNFIFRRLFIKYYFIVLIIFSLTFLKIKITRENLLNFSIEISPNQFIKECSCKRIYFYSTSGPKLNSSCSDEGTFYSPSQKVITMSIYIPPDSKNREKAYKEGILANLIAMREHYPGSSLRLYTDVRLNSDYCYLLCNNPDLFWCDVGKTPSLGNQSGMFFPTWRFLPLGDQTVEYFLSRDLDSLISEREGAAVKDWLGTTKAFQVMRDKQWSHYFPILAGMWGARNALIKDLETLKWDIFNSAKLESYKQIGKDQTLLNDIIYKKRKNEIVAYDSYHCRLWRRDTEVRPFPIQRKDNQTDFVGNIDLGRQKYNLSKCPVECRPEYGKDWEYC